MRKIFTAKRVLFVLVFLVLVYHLWDALTYYICVNSGGYYDTETAKEVCARNFF